MSKVKKLLLVVYCVIAGPDGLRLSGALLLNILNVVYLKVNFYKLIQDGVLTVSKANIYIIAELIIGFILASILYMIDMEVENEWTSSKDKQL